MRKTTTQQVAYSSVLHHFSFPPLMFYNTDSIQRCLTARYSKPYFLLTQQKLINSNFKGLLTRTTETMANLFSERMGNEQCDNACFSHFASMLYSCTLLGSSKQSCSKYGKGLLHRHLHDTTQRGSFTGQKAKGTGQVHTFGVLEEPQGWKQGKSATAPTSIRNSTQPGS